MIKCIIFDLDGVLVDTKPIHFEALNNSLKKFFPNKIISYNDHIKFYDGLPTKEKLKILFGKNYTKNLKIILRIEKLKKINTAKILRSKIFFNKSTYDMFKKLAKKYDLMIATNAIKETLNICTSKLRINKFLSFKISNEDIKNSKPHPEIYMRCMLKGNFSTKETLVVEDSYFGRKSACDSGANLLPVNSTHDLTYKKIIEEIKRIDKQDQISQSQKWIDNDLNILIPMAGLGTRFKKAGFTFPKPLIEVKQKPMIQMVVENINIQANYIFIVQKEHYEKYNLKSFLRAIIPDAKIVIVNNITKGAACTSLLAKKIINNNNPLLICNSDQFIEWNSSKVMYDFRQSNIDGGILTFKSLHPKWSFAKVDENNFVIETAEKKVISDNATVGIYYWKTGKDYVKYAEKMIKDNLKFNNEFYICPVYNLAIKDKKKIKIKEIEKMYGLGTPEDLDFFLKNYKK